MRIIIRKSTPLNKYTELEKLKHSIKPIKINNILDRERVIPRTDMGRDERNCSPPFVEVNNLVKFVVLFDYLLNT